MRLIGLAVVAVLLSGAAHAATEVSFSNEKTYTDPTFEWPKSQKNRTQVEDALRKLFTELADRHLAPGHSLKVNITDIDLAGRIHPDLNPDLRVLDSVTWPRLSFTYEVIAQGAVVASGEAKLADLNYLNGFNRSRDTDRLRYEREMVSDWFRKTLARKT